MTLRDLDDRLARAEHCCSTCGTVFGARVMSGGWLRTGGMCQVCDADGAIYPVEVFDHLRRGRSLVSRMAAGHFNEDTILELLNRQARQRQEAA